MLNSNRVIFPKRDQRRFLELCINMLSCSLIELAEDLEISVRTLSDWKREKFTISERALHNLCKLTKLDIPHGIVIKNAYWYVVKGSEKGGNSTYKKYGKIGGDPSKRAEAWKKWWDKEGKKVRHDFIARKKIRKPQFSKKLAEYVGIMLGDGGISKRQLSITLNRKDDREFADYVKIMIFELFCIRASEYLDKKYNAVDLIVSSTELVDFSVNRLGLMVGNKIKNGVGVPEWIMSNRDYVIACLRGLIDTDGSVIIHRYKVAKKWYEYRKISFSSRSDSLINFVIKSLDGLEIKNRRAKNNTEVWVDGQEDVKKYVKFVGFSNVKHLKRYNK